MTTTTTQMDLSTFGGPFLLYADTVRNLTISAGGYPSPEWFKTQMPRIGAAYDLGEPVEMIAATIAIFGKAAMVRKPKTARQLAVRVVEVRHG